MKKILSPLVALVVILILVVLVLFFYIDHIAKAGIEEGGSYALGVDTTLDSADVGIFTGEFSMSGLNVTNPPNYETAHFLNLNQGDVSVTLGSLRQDVVELPALILTGVDMNLEKKVGKANYDVILDNLKRFESEETTPTEETELGKQFIIRDVYVRDIDVHVDLIQIGGEVTKLDLEIDEIHLTNVGSGTDGGVLLSELSGVLVKAVFAAIVQKGVGLPVELIGDIQNKLVNLESLNELGIGMMTEFGGRLEEVTGRAEEVIGNVEQVGEKVDDALQGIGGLLGGDKDKPKPPND